MSLEAEIATNKGRIDTKSSFLSHTHFNEPTSVTTARDR